MLRPDLTARFPGSSRASWLRLGDPLRSCGSLLLVGCSLTLISDATWGLALGVASLLGFVLTVFAPLADPPEPDDASAPVDAVLEREA